MREEKVRILRAVFGSFYERGSELLFNCPYCRHHKRKFSINLEKGYFKCWICDKRGKNISHPIRMFGTLTSFREWEELVGKVDHGEFVVLFGGSVEEPAETIIKLPEEFISLANKDLPVTALPFIKYLSTRGITRKDILRWKIGYCFEGEYANRVIIPSFNNEGHVNYFVARSIVDYQKKYKNPPVSKNIVFNELYVDWDEDVVIAEGIFDAMKSSNGIPVLGSTLREGSKLFKAIIRNGVRVYIAFDEDAETKTNKIIQSLMSYNVEVFKIDTSGYEDIAEMPQEVFDERKANAAFMTPANHLWYKLSAI